jgi:hypothetical protein
VPAQSARPEKLDICTRIDMQAGSIERSVIQPTLASSNHDQKIAHFIWQTLDQWPGGSERSAVRHVCQIRQPIQLQEDILL